MCAHVLLLMHQTLPLQACPELTFLHFKEDLSVVENHFVHVTFWVNVSTCNEKNTSHRILVHTRTKTGSLEYDGTIIYWRDSCTERPEKSVQCISPTGPAELNRTVNRSHMQIEWELISTHSDSPTFIRTNLTVLYPPKVSSFTIDKNEANGNYLINEGKAVDISCSFDKGNPQTVFFLLDKTGKEINTSRSEEQLTHSLTVRCQDDWPIVGCEGAGSEKNTSVTLLAKCRPQFLDRYPRVVVSGIYENWVFNIKSHTTVVEKCLLWSLPSGNNLSSKVNCNLLGDPPILLLTVAILGNASTKEKIWSLGLYVEGGFSETLVFTKHLAVVAGHGQWTRAKVFLPLRGLAVVLILYHVFICSCYFSCLIKIVETSTNEN
ncbi:uncharacterized protein LOC112568078 isoform X2 [Pomacea canaliculata]|uniref:uncharacterized protein LOC112568078 isoform X2 n=1 Tax=Pomacea canaliculata TaxID=400727 RepID=UPI000D737107|nr:uncharacterized protein LOC112568078 isoform X2 [Pomacea canaliculata]